MAVTIKQNTANVPISTADTVGYGTTTSILVREVGSKIFYVDPSSNPFTLLTDRAGSMTASNPKYEWYEKELRTKADQSNGGNTSGDLTLTVDNANVFQVNDSVLVPRTAEIFRVATIASATTITVVRGVAGTSAAAISDNDDLFVIGSSWAEGADAGRPDEWQEVQKFNYTEIFRRPFGATRTRQGAETYFGDARAQLRAEKAIEHAMDIERAFIWGSRAEDTASSTAVRRYTGGFLFYATSNVKDVSGTLTENELEDWMKDLFNVTASGDSRTLLAAPGVISVIDQLAAGRLQMVPSDKTYGIAVRQLLTAHGTLNLVKHRLLTAGASNAPAYTGYNTYALAIDPKFLKMRPFSNGSTKLRADVQTPGVDGFVDEYLTECGFQLVIPPAHGVLKNVTS